jgi:hypothetical protein
LHLTSERGRNPEVTRAKQLTALFSALPQQGDALIMGDFNFGDDCEVSALCHSFSLASDELWILVLMLSLLIICSQALSPYVASLESKPAVGIAPLWDVYRMLCPLEEGLTFDPLTNTMAAITTRSGKSRRFDRLLLRSQYDPAVMSPRCFPLYI